MGTATARKHCHWGPRTNLGSCSRTPPHPSRVHLLPAQVSTSRAFHTRMMKKAAKPNGLNLPPVDGGLVHISHCSTFHQIMSPICPTTRIRQDTAGFEQCLREILWGRIPAEGSESWGSQTLVPQAIPLHHQPTLAVISLLGQGDSQAVTSQAVVTGALTPGDERPPVLHFSPGFRERSQSRQCKEHHAPKGQHRSLGGLTKGHQGRRTEGGQGM